MTDTIKKSMAEQIHDDISLERIRQLEEAVLALSADIQNLNISLKEMQRVIIKMATNQAQLAERVSMWPYVKIEGKKRRSKPPEDDIY